MTRPLIPTINLSKDTPEVQADAIRHALSTVGFFIVEDSGMDPRVIQRVFADGKTFFSQPMHEKERYLAGSSGAGYTKLLTQALGEGKRDHKETFSWGKNSAKNPQPIPPPYSDNPDSLAAMNDFYASCHRVSHRLLEMFAMALDLSPEHFRHSHSFGLNTAFSQIHYPALTPADQKLLTDLDIRAGSHRDWGSLTMLFQEPGGAPGLQVYLPSTLSPPASLPDKAFIPPITGYTDNVPGWEWFDAPVPDDPGSFLVNVGLAMELWSSGVYKATMHRVIFPTAPEGVEGGDAEVVGKEEKGGLGGRSSLAYFVQPDDDVVCTLHVDEDSARRADNEPLSPVISGGRIDDSIKAITSGQLFDFKLKESMNRTKPTPSGRRS